LVYSVSFWYYYIYWLAFVFGAVSLHVLKRDAILMKSVSLLAFACVYLTCPPDPTSLVVVALGFLLNSTAAVVLGSDRTYYGHEVANLPRTEITQFPYSVMSHPMLVGNAVAFGGTMFNADFRQQWWPLACAHVAMNCGLLAMESKITAPRRRALRNAFTTQVSVTRICSVGAIGAVIVAATTLGVARRWATPAREWLLLASASTGVLTYGYVLYCCYARPVAAYDGPHCIRRDKGHE